MANTTLPTTDNRNPITTDNRLDLAVANEDAQLTKPGYVEIEKHRQTMALRNRFKGMSEKAFLEYIIATAKERGWNSPIIDEITFRTQWLAGK
jgi:hypothetical protein